MGTSFISKPQTYELSKADWNKLSAVGLTDGGIGNGFANTTAKFDDNIFCSRLKAATISFETMRYTFLVKYVDGCFYPVWRKTFIQKADYFINKKGEIVKWD